MESYNILKVAQTDLLTEILNSILTYEDWFKRKKIHFNGSYDRKHAESCMTHLKYLSTMQVFLVKNNINDNIKRNHNENIVKKYSDNNFLHINSDKYCFVKNNFRGSELPIDANTPFDVLCEIYDFVNQ
jgi:glycerol-3-phosphate O-acyltransferase